MPKLLSDSAGSTITDEDERNIERVLSFWFQERQLTAPQVDARMDVWFSDDPEFDAEIRDSFGGAVDLASAGQLSHWAQSSRGRLALIILIDQFRRNIFRNTPKAFAADKLALKLCVEGAMAKADAPLSPIERVFFYMPLQHAESRKVQSKSARIFRRLAEVVSPTYRQTFDAFADFADLHNDIVQQFGRFPHRNSILGRQNTAEEEEYLSGDSPSFGQDG